MTDKFKNFRNKLKLKKVKDHFEDNKKVYLTGVGCLTVGLAVGAFGNGIVIVDSGKVLEINWKSFKINETYMIRRGHPGNTILCKETGEKFASQQRAAEANGISPGALSQHLRGLTDSIKGKSYIKLGETQNVAA